MPEARIVQPVKSPSKDDVRVSGETWQRFGPTALPLFLPIDWNQCYPGIPRSGSTTVSLKVISDLLCPHGEFPWLSILVRLGGVVINDRVWQASVGKPLRYVRVST